VPCPPTSEHLNTFEHVTVGYGMWVSPAALGKRPTNHLMTTTGDGDWDGWCWDAGMLGRTACERWRWLWGCGGGKNDARSFLISQMRQTKIAAVTAWKWPAPTHSPQPSHNPSQPSRPIFSSTTHLLGCPTDTGSSCHKITKYVCIKKIEESKLQFYAAATGRNVSARYLLLCKTNLWPLWLNSNIQYLIYSTTPSPSPFSYFQLLQLKFLPAKFAGGRWKFMRTMSVDN